MSWQNINYKIEYGVIMNIYSAVGTPYHTHIFSAERVLKKTATEFENVMICTHSKSIGTSKWKCYLFNQQVTQHAIKYAK